MTKNLLLKEVVLDGKVCDILIEGNRFARIEPEILPSGDVDIFHAQRDLAIVPPFYNTHTHAAMTLLRGFADDLPLFEWLNDYIWPAEATLTPEDVYHGSRVAALEMIRSGTVFFNDMYWHQSETVRAVDDMGLRAAIGLLFIETSPGVIAEHNRRSNEMLQKLNFSSRIQLTFAPHAVYTVSPQTLKQIAEASRSDGLRVHIHVSETRKEVEDSLQNWGCTPVEHLDRLGLLSEHTLLAHAVHLTDDDIRRIRDRGAVLAHMPASNMKLASGQFSYRRTVEEGKCRLTLGTDGCASNNTLSMFSEMKLSALAAKNESCSPTCAPAEAIFRHATLDGAEAFGIAAGEIRVGRLADAMLVKLTHPLMTGAYHLMSNLVYAGDSSIVDTVICDGRVLMRRGVIPEEKTILSDALPTFRKLAALQQRHEKG